MADAANDGGGGEEGGNTTSSRRDNATTTATPPQPGGDATTTTCGGGDEDDDVTQKKQKLNNGSEEVVSSSSSSSNQNNATGTVVATNNKNSSSSSSCDAPVDETPGATTTTTAAAPPIQTPDSSTTTTPSLSSTTTNKDDTMATSTTPKPTSSASPPFPVTVMYNKKPLTLHLTESHTVLDLKGMITKATGVDPNLQKVLLKGIAKDESLLKDLGVSPATKKILVIGSSIEDVLRVKDVPSASDEKQSSSSSSSDSSGNWCSMTNHKKIIDKGLPDDVMPGILACRDQLPPFPLHGMLSSKGSKVRLTFKLEIDELWIGTFERTEKVPIGTIRSVTSQPITGYEHYHIMALQLGPTEASRFFIYWLPAQYVDAIKDALQQ